MLPYYPNQITEGQKRQEGQWNADMRGNLPSQRTQSRAELRPVKPKHPTREQVWSFNFWQDFFFKHEEDSPSQILENCDERRQLHSATHLETLEANTPVIY